MKRSSEISRRRHFPLCRGYRSHAQPPDVLVTSDNALLGLAGKTPFSIVNPVKFKRKVEPLDL